MNKISNYLNNTSFDKTAKKLSKSEYTPEVENLVQKTKKFFPFISDVFEMAKNYIIEASFDGLLTYNELKALTADKALSKIDFISPKKLQVVWVKK